jgi:hypothetical protein
LPGRLSVIQKDTDLAIKRTIISEYEDNTILQQNLVLDGKEQAFKPDFGNAQGTITAHRSTRGDTLFIESKISFKNGDRTVETTTTETWTLQDHRKLLSVNQSSNSFGGKRTLTAIYEKQ